VLRRWPAPALLPSYAKGRKSNRRSSSAPPTLCVGNGPVLEHAVWSFGPITGVSRSFTHELVGTGRGGYSQLSQRYVNESSRLREPDRHSQKTGAARDLGRR